MVCRRRINRVTINAKKFDVRDLNQLSSSSRLYLYICIFIFGWRLCCFPAACSYVCVSNQVQTKENFSIASRLYWLKSCNEAQKTVKIIVLKIRLLCKYKVLYFILHIHIATDCVLRWKLRNRCTRGRQIYKILLYSSSRSVCVFWISRL